MSFTLISLPTSVWADQYYFNGQQNIFYMSNYGPISKMYIELQPLNDYADREVEYASLVIGNNYTHSTSGTYPVPVGWEITNDWRASRPDNPIPTMGNVVAQFMNYTPYLQIDITQYVKNKFLSGSYINGIATGFTSVGNQSNFYSGQVYGQAIISLFCEDDRDDFHIYAVKDSVSSASVKFYAVVDAPAGKTINAVDYYWWMNGTNVGSGQSMVLSLTWFQWYEIECRINVSYKDGTSEPRLERISVFNPGTPGITNEEPEYAIKILNNYGKAPLLTHIEDVSSYATVHGVYNPRNWVWDISNGVTKIGKRIDVLFEEPGTYSVTMNAYGDDGNFTHTYDDIIFVLDDYTEEGNQLELAHHSAEDSMRHKISTTHVFNDDKSSISFDTWDNTNNTTDVGDERIFTIKGDDTCLARNVMPMVPDAFRMGSESTRWKNIVSEESDSELNQSKSLRLWGGK